MLKVGDKIGMLTLLKKEIRTIKDKKRSYFYCRCDCGNEKWIRADGIGPGKTISCGCYNKENNYIKANDIKGRRFGRLVALEPTAERDKFNSAVIWKCKCDCGNIVYVSHSTLCKGDVKSCECLRKETSKNNAFKARSYLKDTSYKENTSLLSIDPNKDVLKNNKSGVTGVCWDKCRQKWVAQLTIKGRHINLGRFKNKEDAIKARKDGEKKYFKPVLDKYKQ